MNTIVPFTPDELADMVWAKTGKNPSAVHTQGLLVVASFADGATSVHRIEHLVIDAAMGHRLGIGHYLKWEAGQ